MPDVTAAPDVVYAAGRAGQWWYRCDRGRGLFGPFGSEHAALIAQLGHRASLHHLSPQDEQREVARP